MNRNHFDKNWYAWNYVSMFCIQIIAILVMIGTYEPKIKLENNKQESNMVREVKASQASTIMNRSEQVLVGIPYEVEGHMVAEIYAKGLERANIPVTRVYLKEGENMIHAYRAGKINLYPEYILNAYRSLYQAGKVGNVYKKAENFFLMDDYLYSSVKNYDSEHEDMVLLIPAPFNCGKGMVMTRLMSKRYGVRTISALCRQATFIRYVKDKNTNNLNKTTKNSTNQLTEIYGNFYFQSEEVFPTDICYIILRTHFGDVMEMSQTNPVIVKEDFVRLVDDKVAYLSNQVSPAVRKEIYAAYPEINAVLQKVTENLTTSVLTEMKAKVEYENEDYNSVVNDYFDSIK